MSREQNYWTRFAVPSHSRRTLLRRATVAGTGLMVAAAGCTVKGRSQTGAGTSSSGATSNRETAQSGGTLNAFTDKNPSTLDPQLNNTASTVSFAGAVLSRLFSYKLGPDPQIAINHDLQNDLALSAESPDAITWTIKLRPNTKFHNVAPVNGHAVEAEDIKSTFIRALAPRSPSRGTFLMMDPNQIETPDHDTIVFKLKYPYAPLPFILASPSAAWIFPREAGTGGYDPSKQLIGSGPFIFDSYTPDVAVALKKNPDFYEKGLPYVDAVRQIIIPSSAQTFAQLLSGNLDVAGNVDRQNIPTAKKSLPKAQVYAVTSGGANIVYFQLGNLPAPFQDIRLRRAVSLAIDRDTIGKVAYDNQFEPHFYVKMYLGKWALTMDELPASTRQYYQFNLDQAKQLVQQAGGSDLNLQFMYMQNGFTDDYRTVAQMVYNMLKALPWNITPRTLDFNKDFLGGGKGVLYGNFPGNAMLWGGINTAYAEAGEFIFNYYDSRSANNQEKLKDPELDAMIDQAWTIIDPEKRRQAYLDVQKYIADKMYSVAGMAAPNGYTIVQPWVHNYSYSPEPGNTGQTWARLWLKK